ncbi:hypothetical protein PZA11_000035 [Diplocarpon coronariae]
MSTSTRAGRRPSTSHGHHGHHGHGHGHGNGPGITTTTSAAIPNGKACRFCTRQFAKTEHLIRHERCHTKERPFQCSICGKNYSRNDTLIRHRRTHGSNTTTVAPEVFSNNDAATTSDAVEAPATPMRLRNKRASLSSLSSPPVSGALAEAAGFQSPGFDARPALDFPAQMFGHDVYPAAELGPAGYQSAGTVMAQIDPTLAGENLESLADLENLDGSARMTFPGPFLDPALQQYPPRPNLYPPYPPPDHMPYVPPPADHFQCWLVGQDFDLPAFNEAFLPPTAAEFLGLHGPHSAPQWKDHDMPSPETGAMLSLRLRWERDLVPNLDFLNVAIQLFFTGFNPIFPIFHAPTWRPSEHSLLLLLSICSIGTLFMGSDATTIQAAKMFETVHQTIQGSWATISSKPARERLAFIQAALIGQIFAYLSGNPKYLGLVKNFHINLLARRSDLLESTRAIPRLESEAPEELDEAWASWARDEEVSRQHLGLGASFQGEPLAVPSARRGFEEALICWYHAYEETRTTQDPDALCLMVLYHEIFMSLLVDFRQLELAIGSNAPEAVAYARAWSTSVDAQRAIIHASLIHRQAEGIRYDAEPALHVPRSMFLAARAWYCYIHFDTSDQTRAGDGDGLDAIPEIKMFNIDPLQYLPGANGYDTGKPMVSEAATLGRLMDLLEQVGHWGIARRFAVIFRSLIYGEQQLV